jgi:hypothetical protein
MRSIWKTCVFTHKQWALCTKRGQRMGVRDKKIVLNLELEMCYGFGKWFRTFVVLVMGSRLENTIGFRFF